MTPQENTVSAPPNTAQVDIVLPQAHAYNERIARFVNSEGQPLDISAWTFAMDIRQEHDSAPVLSCTIANGRLERNDTIGQIVLNLSLADVQLLGVGRYRYDLRVIRPTFTNVWYPVTGYLRTTPHITR
jgi:hypothetical protein